MRIHRSHQTCGFTTLPNHVLQDRRLTYTSRGLLGDLLSRADGWREDGQQMADSSPQTRGVVAKALQELTRAGYYRVDTVRQPDGKLISEAHVFDSPQPPPVPGANKPESGEPPVGSPEALLKNREKEPSLPAAGGSAPETHEPETSEPESPEPESPEPETPEPETSETPEAEVEEVAPEVREAVALLFRVLRPEPRLRLGAREALALAPLVVWWLKLGASERDLSTALLQGLPQRIHAPVGLLRNRLTRKRPPAPPMPPTPPTPGPQPAAPARRWHECAKCADPVPRPGICRSCAGLAPPPTALRDGIGSCGAAVAVRGAARVRAALRGSQLAAAGALTP